MENQTNAICSYNNSPAPCCHCCHCHCHYYYATPMQTWTYPINNGTTNGATLTTDTTNANQSSH